MEFAPEMDGPRLVRPAEESASNWLSQICFNDRDASDAPPPLVEGDPMPADAAPGSDSATYAIFHRGLPVSQISVFWEDVLFYGYAVRAGFIGGVCTHPDYRGQRLAGKLLAFCTQKLVEGKARFMIISGGRDLYRRAGTVDMGQFAGIYLRKGTGMAANPQYAMRIATVDDASACARLYASEPVRFRRTAEPFSPFLRPEPPGFHAEKLLITLHDQPAAYLFLFTPWDDQDNPGSGRRGIFEYAGSRTAVAQGLQMAIEQFGLQEIYATIPWQDVDAWSPLQTGVPAWVGLPDHTLRILDFPGLMRDLRGYMRSVIPADLLRGLRFEQSGPLLAGKGEDRLAIRRGKETVERNGAEMSRLVFGPDSSQMRQVLTGSLKEICDCVYPLPAYFTGLDYH